MSFTFQRAVARLYAGTTGSLRAWFTANNEDVQRAIRRGFPRPGTELGHRDVGQKIGHARKDIAAMLRASRLAELEAEGPAVAYKAVTKAAALGTFDVHAARAAGDTTGAAYLKHELYRTVASRPDDSPAARSAYLAGCAYLREHLPAAQTFDGVYWLLEQWKMAAGWHWSRQGAIVVEYVTVAAMDARFGQDRTYGSPGREISGDRVQAAGYASSPQNEGPTRKEYPYVLLKATSKEAAEHAKTMAMAMGPRFMGAVRGRGQARYGNATTPAFHDDIRRKAAIYERADDWSWADEGEAPEGQPKKRNEFVLVRSGLTGVRNGGPVLPAVTGAGLIRTFGLRGLEHGIWMGDDDADTGEASAYGAFTDLAIIVGLPPEMMGFRGRLGLALGARGSGKFAAHYEPSFRVINMTKTKGAGSLAHEWGHAMDHWLAESTGARGKSTYCSEGTKTGDSNVDYAFAAVMLAIFGPDGSLTSARRRNPHPENLRTDDITGMDDYNTRVGILNAWYATIKKAQAEARGGNDEPEDTEGMAAAKRELDAHTLAIMELKKAWTRYRSNRRKGWRESVTARAEANLQITRYYRDAKLLGEYWARPQELFARAWESWIEDELHARGWTSGYLVVGTRVPSGAMREQNGKQVLCEPYPQGEERAAIGAAMKRLAATLAGR